MSAVFVYEVDGQRRHVSALSDDTARSGAWRSARRGGPRAGRRGARRTAGCRRSPWRSGDPGRRELERQVGGHGGQRARYRRRDREPGAGVARDRAGHEQQRATGSYPRGGLARDLERQPEVLVERPSRPRDRPSTRRARSTSRPRSPSRGRLDRPAPGRPLERRGSAASKAALLRAPTSSPASRRRSGSRPVRTTSAPSARAWRVVSSPMPALPPMITTGSAGQPGRALRERAAGSGARGRVGDPPGGACRGRVAHERTRRGREPRAASDHARARPAPGATPDALRPRPRGVPRATCVRDGPRGHDPRQDLLLAAGEVADERRRSARGRGAPGRPDMALRSATSPACRGGLGRLPAPRNGSGAGLWVARQLTWQIEFFRSPGGFTARIWL